MADPLSVLGAVAAASQLAGSVVKVIEIVRKLNREYKSPKITRQQLTQIEALVNISQDVEENAALQTQNVTQALEKSNQCAVNLQATLQKIAVQQSDSRMRRLVKSISTLRKEKEIETLLANLEREKSALHISISNATNLGVSQTNRDVGNVASDVTQILDTQNNQHEQSAVENTVKKYYVVPNGRAVKDFVGRENVLELIKKAFSTESAESKTVVIRGLGGQGKTQVALEHCRRAEKSGVEAVFWVDAHSESSVKKAFQTMSGEIKRPDDNISEENAVSYVLKTLRDWGKSYVMVFDNYDDVVAFDTIQDFIPDSNNACVIITSRHEKSEELADPDNAIHLEGLVGNESLELLRKTSRLKTLLGSLDDANMIVNRLGHHPLAITQAGSYIRERKIQLSQFMSDYDNRKEEILKYNSQLSKYRRRLNDQEEETVLNVFTTWELSYQLLLKTSENAAEKADLLTLFTFFDCKDISEDLFNAFCLGAQIDKYEEPWPWPVQFLLPCLSKSSNNQSEDEPCQWDNQAFVTILTDLAQLSLVQSWIRDEDDVCHLSLHPLVQDWIRLRTEDDRVQSFSNISAWILKAFLDDKIDENGGSYDITLATKQTILSHIEVYKAHTKFLSHETIQSPKDELKEKPDIPAESIGSFLYTCGYYNDYELLSERVMHSKKITLGLDHKDTLRAMNNLATSYYAKDNLPQAENLYREVLEKHIALFGMKSEFTLQTLRNLAWILFQENKLEQAEEKALTALAGRKELMGEDHPDTLESLSTLASILEEQGKLEESEAIYRKLLAKQEAMFGAHHETTIETIGNLGNNLFRSGRLELAEEMTRRALAEREASEGPGHPETLLSVTLLGEILRHQSRYAEAEEMNRRAYEGRVKVLGQNHRQTLVSLHNLGIAVYYLGRLEEAEKLFRESLGRTEKALGSEHLETIKTAEFLALVLRDQGNNEESLLVFQRAVAVCKKCNGKDHPDTTRCVEEYSELSGEMADSLRDDGKDDELLDHLRRALEFYENCVANEDRYTVKCLKNIAEVLYKQGKDEEALSFYERAAAGYEKLYGMEDYDTIGCLVSTGWLLEKIAENLCVGDKNEEALLHYATAGYKKIHGEDDSENIHCLESAGWLLEEQAKELYKIGKKEEALHYYRQAAARYHELHGSDHQRTTRSQGWISRIQGELAASSDHLGTAHSFDDEEEPRSQG